MIFTASEGMWITQKSNVDIWNRICTKELATSQKNFEKKWHEITDAKKQEYDAEYAQWLAEQEQSFDSGIDDGTGI